MWVIRESPSNGRAWHRIAGPAYWPARRNTAGWATEREEMMPCIVRRGKILLVGIARDDWGRVGWKLGRLAHEGLDWTTLAASRPQTLDPGFALDAFSRSAVVVGGRCRLRAGDFHRFAQWAALGGCEKKVRRHREVSRPIRTSRKAWRRSVALRSILGRVCDGGTRLHAPAARRSGSRRRISRFHHL